MWLGAIANRSNQPLCFSINFRVEIRGNVVLLSTVQEPGFLLKKKTGQLKSFFHFNQFLTLFNVVLSQLNWSFVSAVHSFFFMKTALTYSKLKYDIRLFPSCERNIWLYKHLNTDLITINNFGWIKAFVSCSSTKAVNILTDFIPK